MNTKQQEVIQVQQQFWAALQNKDPLAFEQVLAESFIGRSPGQPNQSRSTFIHTLTSFPGQVLSVGSENLEVHLFGEVAVLTGVQVARLKLPNGAEVKDTLALTNIYRQDGERWQMVLSHAVEVAGGR